MTARVTSLIDRGHPQCARLRFSRGREYDCAAPCQTRVLTRTFAAEWSRVRTHVARAGAAREPPADDPLRVDADQRRRERDRLPAAADLDPARLPFVAPADVVDHDRPPPVAGDVAELLGQLELVTADVDRVPHGV